MQQLVILQTENPAKPGTLDRADNELAYAQGVCRLGGSFGAAPSGRTTSAALLAIRQHQQHNAAMATSITVRDVPDQTRNELASRAAMTGRSLQEYLRAKLIELARQPDAEALVARMRARKAAHPATVPAEQILTYRDADRR